MAEQSWVDAPIKSGLDGAVVANTTTAGSILMPESRTDLSRTFWRIGKILRVRSVGRASGIVTTPGTLTFAVRWGSPGVVCAATQAFTLNTSASVNLPYLLELYLSCRATGTASNFLLMGYVEGVLFGSTTVPARIQVPGPTTVPVVSANVDTSTNSFLDFTAQWSIANAGNTITSHITTIEAMN